MTSPLTRRAAASPRLWRTPRTSGITALDARTRQPCANCPFGRWGRALDGRAGLHVYFLIRALSLLEDGGRLAFIVPADTCEGVFSRPLWNWITSRFRLDAVVAFDPDATPFPGVDTNAVILLIQNAAPRKQFVWVRCREAESRDLSRFMQSGLASEPPDSLERIERDLAEGVADRAVTGPRPPPGRSFAWATSPPSAGGLRAAPTRSLLVDPGAGGGGGHPGGTPTSCCRTHP